MKDETTGNYFTETRIALEQYVKDRILLLKLQASEKIARLVALLFTGFLMALLGFFVVLLFSRMIIDKVIMIFFDNTTHHDANQA